MLRNLAQRYSSQIVKSSAPEAWETTANLRRQYIFTSMDAMPARVETASKEFAELRQKIMARSFTMNEVAVGAVRAAELYVFFYFGKILGGRSLPN